MNLPNKWVSVLMRTWYYKFHHTRWAAFVGLQGIKITGACCKSSPVAVPANVAPTAISNMYSHTYTCSFSYSYSRIRWFVYSYRCILLSTRATRPEFAGRSWTTNAAGNVFALHSTAIGRAGRLRGRAAGGQGGLLCLSSMRLLALLGFAVSDGCISDTHCAQKRVQYSIAR